MILEYSRETYITELMVENPPVNAFNVADIATLNNALSRCGRDSEVHAVILRAEGRGFCGGGDVKEVQRLTGFEGILGQAQGSLDLTLAIADCPVLVIRAIHGYCIGLGRTDRGRVRHPGRRAGHPVRPSRSRQLRDERDRAVDRSDAGKAAARSDVHL